MTAITKKTNRFRCTFNRMPALQLGLATAKDWGGTKNIVVSLFLGLWELNLVFFYGERK